LIPATVNAPTLLYGDCLDLLETLPAVSIDAIVHDPPAGIAFMGKAWDDKRGYAPRTDRGRQVLDALTVLGLEGWAAGFVVFMVEVNIAERRVVKPGAHSLTWALPRTADLTTLALRLAGWEIRDSLVHMFGGGFPKSLDVSKAIDKTHGAEREVIGRNPNHRDPDTDHHERWNDAVLDPNITAPATDDAKRWDGWGTALSPGHEQWILARAPLVGTVARNVLEHGTAAINIDACRTPTVGPHGGNNSPGTLPESPETYGSGLGGIVSPPHDLGRWPKNAMLSCSLSCEVDRHTPWCPVGELDRQSGYQRDGVAVRRHGVSGDSAVSFGARAVGSADAGHGGSVGASRYFPRFRYEPKASDRSIPGREDMTNKHPTHKSVELMRWLVRLISPPGGVVLDDFMGSGPTGVACVAEGVGFIGMERDLDSFETARGRIMGATGSPEYAAEANAAKPVGAQLGLL
jgi:DNA modification methylase